MCRDVPFRPTLFHLRMTQIVCTNEGVKVMTEWTFVLNAILLSAALLSSISIINDGS